MEFKNVIIETIDQYYDLGKVTNVSRFSSLQNITCYVETTKGRYVGKIYPPQKQISELRLRLDIINYLQRSGGLVPTLIPNNDGQFFTQLNNTPFLGFMIYDFIDGRPYSKIEMNSDVACIFGVTLANLHNRLDGVPFALDDIPSLHDRKSLDPYLRTLTLSIDEVEVDIIPTLKKFIHTFSIEGHSELLGDWNMFYDETRELLSKPHEVALHLVHCDFHRLHVLNTGINQNYIIDFGHLARGNKITDIILALYFLWVGQYPNLDIDAGKDAFISGYLEQVDFLENVELLQEKNFINRSILLISWCNLYWIICQALTYETDEVWLDRFYEYVKMHSEIQDVVSSKK